MKLFLVIMLAMFIPGWTDGENRATKGCQKTFQVHDGYKRGFLLKQSDVPGRGGVILFPVDYPEFKTVTLQRGGRTVARFYYAGIYTEDGQNRPMWRSAERIETYPKKVILRARAKVLWCAKVQDPTVRND
jgi:hypothetical protein